MYSLDLVLGIEFSERRGFLCARLFKRQHAYAKDWRRLKA